MQFVTRQDAHTAVFNSGVYDWEWEGGLSAHGFADWLWENKSGWDTKDQEPIREYIISNGGNPEDYGI